MKLHIDCDANGCALREHKGYITCESSGICSELQNANQSKKYVIENALEAMQLDRALDFGTDLLTAQTVNEWRSHARSLEAQLAEAMVKCDALERECGFTRTAYDQLTQRMEQEIQRAQALVTQRAELVWNAVPLRRWQAYRQARA